MDLSPNGKAAFSYATRGWAVFRCRPDSKEPFGGRGHVDATTDPETVRRWWQEAPDANIGLSLRPSGLVAVDVDTYKPECQWASWSAGREMQATLLQRSARGGCHYIFSAEPQEEFAGSPCLGVDIKHNGYILVEPSTFEGKAYRFETNDDPAPCPGWIPRRVNRAVEVPKRHSAKVNKHVARLRRMLADQDNTLERDAWIKLALALKGEFADEMRADFLEFSHKYPNAANGEAERVWDTAKPNGRVTIGTAYYLLNGGGADLTEDGVAMAFTSRFDGKLKFDHDRQKWFEWTGDHWQADGKQSVYGYCRELSRELADGAEPKINAIVRKAAFAGSVDRLARSDPIHAVNQDEWDQDPFLLGCPGVVVDLKTGLQQQPDPALHITKRTSVAPSEMGCREWLTFLFEATAQDVDLVRFLQQWCGYCLTGDIREHALLFVYGPGGNGKSVFLETISYVLGDYAATASMDAFTASHSDRHPTDLAMLRGARLVTASETEDGRAWAEARIKQLTGGDKITARFMRQDFFTYQPNFKLTVVGNHKPALRIVDEAARRRFNILPFIVKPSNPDRQLLEKLKSEAPGILQWMIDGCLDWHEHGLVRPESLVTATSEYFESQDVLGQWLDERCRIDVTDMELFTPANSLFKAWSAYAASLGEKPGTQTALGNALNKRGLVSARLRGGDGKQTRIWKGIVLLPVGEFA